jgi:hypothetical protein
MFHHNLILSVLYYKSTFGFSVTNVDGVTYPSKPKTLSSKAIASPANIPEEPAGASITPEEPATTPEKLPEPQEPAGASKTSQDLQEPAGASTKLPEPQEPAGASKTSQDLQETAGASTTPEEPAGKIVNITILKQL